MSISTGDRNHGTLALGSSTGLSYHRGEGTGVTSGATEVWPRFTFRCSFALGVELGTNVKYIFYLVSIALHYKFISASVSKYYVTVTAT